MFATNKLFLAIFAHTDCVQLTLADGADRLPLSDKKTNLLSYRQPTLLSHQSMDYSSSPTITTCKGEIRGKRLIDEPEFQADAYLVSAFFLLCCGLRGVRGDHVSVSQRYPLQGIPYAQPPLGDLRFKVSAKKCQTFPLLARIGKLK